jgi:hypothetical protein
MPGWLFALVVVPRLIVLILAWLHPSFCLQPDSYNYLTLADMLRMSHAFSLDPASQLPETFRVPGYPLFLAVFTGWGLPTPHTALLIASVQTAVSILTSVLIWRWLKGFTSLRGAAAGTLLFSWDLVILLHAPISLTDTLFLFVLTLAVRQAWAMFDPSDWRRLAWAGFLWGCLPLIRPVAVFAGFLVSFFWVWNKKAFLIFLASASLLPLLWTCRNIAVAQYWGISSQYGRDLLMDTTASIEALAQNISLQDSRNQIQAELASRYPDGFPAQAAQERAFRAIAFQKITQHPFVFLRYELQGALKILGGTGIDLLLPLVDLKPRKSPGDLRPRLSGEGTFDLLRQYPLLIFFHLVYSLLLLLLYVFFWGGVYRLYRHGQKKEAFFLAGGALYFLFASSHVGTYRLRMPMMPFLVGGAAAFWSFRFQPR